MVKRICGLILALILLCGGCLADLKWDDSTPALKKLKDYIEKVNNFLAANGEEEINSIFEMYDSIAELGVTAMNNSATPEDVTVSVYLYYDNIHYLLLRVDEPARFARIAAAFRQALYPDSMTQEEALKTPTERAKKALQNPTDSFEDYVEEERLQGMSPREFYAYYPNQYHDGVNWIQLLLIFPLEGGDGDNGIISGESGEEAAFRDSDQDAEYDGYYASDDFDHYEIFATATPEPDSAAAEYDEWEKNRNKPE